MKITDKAVYFWTGKDFLSNFYFTPFKHEGIVFKWSEQAIMWEKAKFFGADRVADEILKAQTPQECKGLGRSREIPFDNAKWEEVREDLYFKVLKSKFGNGKLQKQLLDTGNKELVEASPYDKIWGCGLAQDDSRITDKSKWLGLNLLGVVLMRVREDINV